MEVASDFALLINASDPEAIGKAIVEIHRRPELRHQLRRNGLLNYCRINWRKVVEKTAIYLQEFFGDFKAL